MDKKEWAEWEEEMENLSKKELIDKLRNIYEEQELRIQYYSGKL